MGVNILLDNSHKESKHVVSSYKKCGEESKIKRLTNRRAPKMLGIFEQLRLAGSRKEILVD
jgi:hypothetical protein